MKKLALMAFVGLAPLSVAAPLVAQNAPQNGVLVIYGNDKCPTNSDGEEIVVCVRRPAEERFRIPRELRDQPLPPQKQSWAVRAQDALSVGATGTGSCSTVGPGGGIGCGVQSIARGKKEATERRQAEQNLPLP